MFVNQGGDTMTGALAIMPTAAVQAALEVAGTAAGRILSFGNRLTGSGAVSIRTLTDSVTAFHVLDSDGGTLSSILIRPMSGWGSGRQSRRKNYKYQEDISSWIITMKYDGKTQAKPKEQALN
ncbi:MAG: hypothetical protein PHX87_03395 [Candidatus Peribacteraceae bacterium]|nr:hypothetical protein [Candidatus Peribacteraceae bacterium]MDD5742451.1 hypothetical protein [Candidatus Peribacteraceae bacterium]